MSDDYLWDRSGKPDPEVERLERVLGRLRGERQAPDFSRVATTLSSRPRRFFFGLAAAAAFLLAALVWIATRPSDEPWRVARLEGSPRVGSRTIPNSGRLPVGEWLETDARSRARIEIGRIGSVEVGPETRLRVLEASPDEHRLDLLHGEIHAQTWAPPRLFYVNTPSAVAVDLGCAYALEVNEAGAGLLRVTSGWVSLELDGRESRVPAGAACETRPGRGPGTPFFEDAPQALRRALGALDFDAREGAAGDEALDAVLGAARPRDGLTLWYLLSRAEGEHVRRLYDRLAALVPPPAGVTREGILGGSRPMLSLWWDRLGLEPSPWWKKKLKRLGSTGARLTQEPERGPAAETKRERTAS